MSRGAVRGADPYTQGRFTPYDQPERAQCHHVNWRQERTWIGRVHQCSDERSWQLIQNTGNYAWSCRTSGGEHQKGGVTTLGANGGRIQGRGHLVMIMSPRYLRWHCSQDTRLSKKDTQAHTHGSDQLSEIKTRTHLECGVMRVTQTLTDAKVSASFWWHNLYDHTHTHTYKWGNLLPSWNQLATGPQDRHEFTGASGQSHLYCSSGQLQAPKGLTN